MARVPGALVLVALALFPVSTAAQTLPRSAVAPGDGEHRAAVDAAQRWVEVLMREADLPGLQVAVMKDGRVVWSEGFGFADLEHRTPLTPDTRLRVGSLSKALTATAIVTLHEAGRLDLDADVRRYVPAFPEKPHPITSRQLLGHLGGIRHYRDDESTIRHESYADVLEALEIFADDSLLHRPGSMYAYSSYGYNLLGAVVREASGRPFLAYVRDAVLTPADMHRTVADHPDSVIPHRAEFYRESDADGRLLNAPFTDNSYKWPSGGYLSTAEDLVRFVSSLLAGELVRPGLVDTMTTSMVTAAGDTTGYAMGWRPRGDADGRRVIRHGGSSVGGRAFLMAYPDHGLAVAILVNASMAPVFHEEGHVLAHLFLEHPPDEEQIGAGAERLAGTYEFTSPRGEDGSVRGTLHLTGSRGHPGWMRWEGAHDPVPIALVDVHPDSVRVVGAGAHGALRLWAVFDGAGFRGRWDWLGRSSEIEGRRDEVVPVKLPAQAYPPAPETELFWTLPPPGGVDGAVALPEPRGPRRVGTRVFHWILDEAETLAGSATDRREVMAQLFYPARRTRDGMRAAYIPELDLLRRGLRLHGFPPFADLADRLEGYARVRTGAWSRAPLLAEEGPYPVVLVSPGGNMSRHWHTALSQELASHGYVVAVLSHAHSGLDVFPGGGFLASHPYWHPDDEVPRAEVERRDRALAERLARDAGAVLDGLARQNRVGGRSGFRGALDLERVAIIGHSRGGSTVTAACGRDSRLDACIVFDNAGSVSGLEPAGPQPRLAVRPPWPTGRARRLAASLSAGEGDAFEVVIPGAGHDSFTDLPLVDPAGHPSDGIDPREAHELLSRLTLAFVDRYLLRRGPAFVEVAASSGAVEVRAH